MLGVNNFYDYDYWMGHSRTSLGFEARGSVLDFNANRYQKIDSSGSTEHVKDGWDYNFEMQIPYLHTSNFFLLDMSGKQMREPKILEVKNLA